MKKTRTSKLITISLPPKLYQQALRTAKARHMTRSELFREALRRFQHEEKEWQTLLAYGQTKARSAKINTEEDIERLIDQSRD